MKPSFDAPRAVILAAGMGSRLRPLTLERPKPLVEVLGTPILHNALRNLASVGVKEVTLVVGYRHELIERSCRNEFAGVRITYARSDVYPSTGSAYSLWLARETLLKGDTLVLEGDVFFERNVLTRLLASPHADVGAVAPITDNMSGSAALLTAAGLMTQILMNQKVTDQRDVPLFKTMNLYRLSAETLRQTLVPALDDAIVRGETRAYVEQILSRLIDTQCLRLGSSVCGDLNWFEIDDQRDLRIAERIFAAALPPAAAAFAQPEPAEQF
jgi:NDP-sugar pyrophosphorylase family protein